LGEYAAKRIRDTKMIKENFRLFLLLLALLHGGLSAADAQDYASWDFFHTKKGRTYYTKPKPTIEITTKDEEKFVISLEKLKGLSPVLRDMLEACDPTGSAKIPMLSKTFLILTYAFHATAVEKIDFTNDAVLKKLYWHEKDATEFRREFVELQAEAASLLMKNFTSWRTTDEMHSYYETIRSSTKEPERFTAYRELYQYLVKVPDEGERKKFIEDAKDQGIDERLLQMPSKKFLQNSDYVQLVPPYIAWVLWARSKLPLAATLDIKFEDLVILAENIMRSRDIARPSNQNTGNAIRHAITKKFNKFVQKEGQISGYDTLTQQYLSTFLVLLNALNDMGLEPLLARSISQDRYSRNKLPTFFVNGYNKDN
jgi:hypothetical protein